MAVRREACTLTAFCDPPSGSEHGTGSVAMLLGGTVAAHFALGPALAVPWLFPGCTGAAVSGLIRG